ncbi:MAG: SAM-dependent methyltransferase [Planctomycetota bacterium]|jgi:SAM-dependent methyltransferase
MGCGTAEMTQAVAERHPNSDIMAFEVDREQHERNLLQPKKAPNVKFHYAGAERIPLSEGTVDMVLLFKSLHHVPINMMGQALREIHRILKPGGIAHVSEPVFLGDFNEVLRIFHDEEHVRREAFKNLKSAVKTGMFELVVEEFHLSPVSFKDFGEFEERVINVSHTDHRLDEETMARVKAKFDEFCGPDGANFQQPIRLDVLRKAPVA